ncbi:hypothetical protein YC2023_071250 [Brassica napus]
MGKSPRTIRRPGNKNTKSAWKCSSKRRNNLMFSRSPPNHSRTSWSWRRPRRIESDLNKRLHHENQSYNNLTSKQRN